MAEKFSKKLWENRKYLAIFSQYTPFIISLAAGNLPLETFEGYLYQDIHYLTAYAQASYIAVEYATDKEAKEEFQKIGDDSVLYIESYASFFEELGLKYKPGSVAKNEATKKYIDFLLNAARTKVTVYTFAAMTPCERLYAYLGWTVKHSLTEEELQANKYKRWIIENSSGDPEPLRKRRNLTSAQSMEYFIDKLSVGLPQEELDKIEEFYKQGFEHELDFNLAQQIVGQEVVVPLCKDLHGFNFPIVSDFDLCCKKSTCDSQSLKAYEQRIANALLQIVPPGNIQKAFESVSKLEKTSFPTSVSFGEFEAKGDCINFLLNVLQKDDLDASAYVISAYWSDESIKSTLFKEGLSGKISHVGNQGSIESSIDKLEAFNNIIQQKNDTNDNEGKKLSLYIGDSIGDLLCLLQADIGVIYEHEPNDQLRNVEKHFSISLIPLFRGVILQQMRKSLEIKPQLSWEPTIGITYTFTNWAEIEAFILGSQARIIDIKNEIKVIPLDQYDHYVCVLFDKQTGLNDTEIE